VPCSRCGRICHDDFTLYSTMSLKVKELRKSTSIWRRYTQDYSGTFSDSVFWVWWRWALVSPDAVAPSRTVCLPLLIFPCTTNSRGSLLAPAHPHGPRRRAIKRLCACVFWAPVYAPQSDPQSMSEPSRLVYRRISGVLVSAADVGVMFTLT